MFNFIKDAVAPERLNKIMEEEPTLTSDEEFIIRSIEEFKVSKKRRDMLDAERYYKGQHDILDAKREVIGDDGELIEIHNLPNHHIVDNQYGKAVDQKKNYLFSKPVIFSSKNEALNEELDVLFADKFQRLIKNVGHDAINCGISYVYTNYDATGNFSFQRIRPFQLIPLWKDAEHQELESAIHFYEYETLDGETVEKVEIFDSNGIHHFYLEDGALVPTETPHESYFTITGEEGEAVGYNWEKIPIIAFKRSGYNQPLLNRVKSLQDGINTIISTFMNNMQEDARNTIMILVNYDGENLGEFRRNLSEYGAVKVRNDGDVRTLQVAVDSTNYESIIKILKNALLENIKSFDAKDDRLTGNTPNQMNIKSMYSDIDLDADDTETEFKASFELLIEFVKHHLQNISGADYSKDSVKVTFNRNIMINESEVILSIRNSEGLLSTETLLEQHPWVENVREEMERLEKENEQKIQSQNILSSAIYDELPPDNQEAVENDEEE